MTKYTVFIFFAYNRETPQGDFIESTECQVIAENEAEALKRVKELLPKKKFHYLKRIVEEYVK